MARLTTLGSRCVAVLLLASGVVLAQTQTQTQAPSPTQTPVQTPTGPIDAADIDALLKQFNVPGVSIAVIHKGRIEWAQKFHVKTHHTYY